MVVVVVTTTMTRESCLTMHGTQVCDYLWTLWVRWAASYLTLGLSTTIRRYLLHWPSIQKALNSESLLLSVCNPCIGSVSPFILFTATLVNVNLQTEHFVLVRMGDNEAVYHHVLPLPDDVHAVDGLGKQPMWGNFSPGTPRTHFSLKLSILVLETAGEQLKGMLL